MLDLPLERQKSIAKEMGYAHFDDWIKHMEDLDREAIEIEEEILRFEAKGISEKDVERMIYDLQTNPYAIEYYRRITQNDDLTVEEQIAHLKSLITN